MSQKLVTKKNRKVRLLRELYPDIRCKVLYQRDYIQLVVKYGLDHPDHLEALPPPTRMPGKPVVTRLEDRGSRAG
ncbi:MAG: hypothetical protein FWJ92_06870 [Actinomycetes bacterium]|jgi:hypothetical protein|nr:hypothetical protein [Acidimicrobiia bacterium]